ncbi:alpha/beta fold hydrolase [Luteipulveratus flavus]|uniref:Alpha/beta fold hydrolase n=1 Tax=Luteipulveratus flavus TaxID=3031728 RepID=A0ABT6CBQ0_9MICO|nr:alpha/beta fold hydrolase [Luteipulveratus sp. YIM 133296]MDF8266330.1 alpha/beta fold hydrolase [Luteipulveratus sp. YIM 133296]
MSTIQYARKGSGEPVVLIHGIGHRRQAWGEVFDRLAESYDVVAVDLPGHGESPPPRKPYGFRPLSVAEQLEELFADLGLDRPHVVGNSLGGYLSLLLARRGSVASATVLSPGGFYTVLEGALGGGQLVALKLASYSPAPVLRLFARTPALRRLSQGSLYARTDTLDPELAYSDSLNLRRARGFAPFFLHLVGSRFEGDVVVPVTVAWAAKDRILFPHQAGRARTRLPAATHTSIPGAGHISMHDAPELVARIVVDQIEATSRRPDPRATVS